MRSERLSSLLVFGGLTFGLASIGSSVLFLLDKAGLTEQQLVTTIYGNVEWLAPVSLVICVIAFMIAERLSELPERRPFNFVPLDGSWWEYLVIGTVGSLGSFVVFPMLFALIVVPIILPYKLIAYYILGSSSTLIKLAVSVPVVIFAINVMFSVAFISTIQNEKGELIGDEGSLAKPGFGRGLRDVAQVYYFSCLAFLGTGFGEYRPTGYCRVVVLLAVILGRLLELVVISIGASLLVDRLAIGR